MLFEPPLSRIFGNGPARALDALLASDGLTVRQVARIAGVAPGTAATALQRLERQRLVHSRPVGGAIQYWLNRQHFALTYLQELEAAGRALAARLPDSIASILGSRPRAIVAFGSTTRSGPRTAQDLDLLVIAHSEAELEAWHGRVDDVGEALASTMGGPLDVLLVSPPTAAEMKRPFWREVVRDGVVLDGELAGVG